MVRTGEKMSVTKIHAIAHGTPDNGGYVSRVWLYNGDDVIYHGPCRVEPNPFDPNDPKIRWDQKPYFRLAAGTYQWTMYDSPKHGRVPLLIGEVPGCGSKPTGTEIEWHCAESWSWSGSAGCQTIPTTDWPEFIKCFEPNDSGIYVLERTL